MGEKRTVATGGGIAVTAARIMADAGSWPEIVHGPYHRFAAADNLADVLE